MAEIGLVASVVQIADTGIKLSITLYTFAETVLKADKSIREIASDVSLTSSVLEELGQNLKKDQKSRLCSENAMKTAEGIVKECAAIFNDINGTLETALEKIKPRAASEKRNGRDGTHGGRKMAVAALERLKWPFLQPKMLLLKSNLDRLKSTLVLMLNVITYARKVSEDDATPSTLEDQRRLIEDLAHSNQEYTRKFKELTKAVEAGQGPPETVKPVRAMENMPTNMVLPPSESFDIAGDTSPDITSRLITLSKQHLPPHVGEQSDELAHYCLLINHLLQRIDAVQYKIKGDLRRRIRNDVVHMHQREADQLKEVHGHRRFTTIMGSAISWAEILHFRHPSELGYSGTLRNLTHPDWSERDWTDFDALLGRGEDSVSPEDPPTSISRVECGGTPGQHAKMVKCMIALEELMRPFAAGEENTPKIEVGTSYGARRRTGSRTAHLSEFQKLELEQRATSATDKSKGRARARASTGVLELHNGAEQSLSQKSYRVNDATMVHSARRESSSVPHHEADGLTTDPTISRMSMQDSSQPVTPSSRFNTRSGLHAPELLQRKYASDGEVFYGETTSPSTLDPLDQERARVRKALDDRREAALSMRVLLGAEKSDGPRAEDLQVLEALTSIRNKIQEVANSEQMATRSANEIAEDAIFTAKELWYFIQRIYENTHGHLPYDDQFLEVARLADLVLDSVSVTLQACIGLTPIERKFDDILGAGWAIKESEAVRKASKKFALLTNSQRHALREAWALGTKSNENIQIGKQQVLLQSIDSLPARRRNVFRRASKKFASLTTSQWHALRKPWAPRRKPNKMLSLELAQEHLYAPNRRTTASYPPSRTIAQEAVPQALSVEYPIISKEASAINDNELSPGQATIWTDSEQLKFKSAPGDGNNEVLRSKKSYSGSADRAYSFSDSDEPTGTEQSAARLATRAALSPTVRPRPRRSAKDAESVGLGDVGGLIDYYGYPMYASRSAADDQDDSPQEVEPPVTRPRSPDIVDDLLAEWTTLLR